jgi:hypothetical protein
MLSYLQKPAVQLTLFLTAVVVAGAYFYVQQQNMFRSAPAGGGAATAASGTVPPPPAGMGQASSASVPVSRRDVKGSLTTEAAKLNKLVLPPLQAEPPTLVKPAEPPPPATPPNGPVLPNLVQVDNPKGQPPFHPELPKVFAPRGMLIKVALVITLESNATGTPVLGMVTEDVYFGGKLIVPAGTQVQSNAVGNSKFRDRIDIRGAFRFIWDDGSEYVINGIALNHEPLPDGTHAITDGSPGIRGRIVKTDNYLELKILISEALQGYARSQQSTFNSVLGIVPENTNRNAALGSGISGASAFSSLLVRKMEQDLEYVQVPAGTIFYLFTEDVFEPELRSIAGIRQGNQPISGLKLQELQYQRLTENAAKALELQRDELKGQLENQNESESRHQDLINRTRALMQSTSLPASPPPTEPPSPPTP